MIDSSNCFAFAASGGREPTEESLVMIDSSNCFAFAASGGREPTEAELAQSVPQSPAN